MVQAFKCIGIKLVCVHLYWFEQNLSKDFCCGKKLLVEIFIFNNENLWKQFDISDNMEQNAKWKSKTTLMNAKEIAEKVKIYFVTNITFKLEIVGAFCFSDFSPQFK